MTFALPTYGYMGNEGEGRYCAQSDGVLRLQFGNGVNDFVTGILIVCAVWFPTYEALSYASMPWGAQTAPLPLTEFVPAYRFLPFWSPVLFHLPLYFADILLPLSIECVHVIVPILLLFLFGHVGLFRR